MGLAARHGAQRTTARRRSSPRGTGRNGRWAGRESWSRRDRLRWSQGWRSRRMGRPRRRTAPAAAIKIVVLRARTAGGEAGRRKKFSEFIAEHGEVVVRVRRDMVRFGVEQLKTVDGNNLAGEG